MSRMKGYKTIIGMNASLWQLYFDPQVQLPPGSKQYPTLWIVLIIEDENDLSSIFFLSLFT